MNRGLRQIFSDIAEHYEPINHLLTFGLDVIWRKKAVQRAVIGGGSRWLDICAGTGETAAYLRMKAPPETQIIAADFSMPMLRVLKQKPNSKWIDIVLTRAAALPFPDNSMDLIIISFATRNLNSSAEGLTACIMEFHRILKPGGRFINLETTQPESVILRRLFHWFIFLIVQPIGRLISGSESGYAYLSKSMASFYSAPELAGIMAHAGFRSVTYQYFFPPVVAIHYCEK